MMVSPAKCPECGGRIQATEEIYWDTKHLVEMKPNQYALLMQGDISGDVRFYCENDHSLTGVVERVD